MTGIDGTVILRPGEGRTIPLGTFAMSVKADTGVTGGAFTLLEAEEPPGFGPPMHIHRDAAEAFYVLEGEYRIFIGDDEWLCPTGSFVFIPAGVVHGFRVRGMPSRKLNLYTPAAMVGYVDDLRAELTSGGGQTGPRGGHRREVRHAGCRGRSQSPSSDQAAIREGTTGLVAPSAAWIRREGRPAG